MLKTGWGHNRSRKFNGEFLTFYNSSSDFDPVLDISYEESSATHLTDLWIEGDLKEQGW